MKILQINSMYYGSTGKIMRLLAETLESKTEVYLAYSEFDGKGGCKKNDIIIGNKPDAVIHHILGRLTGLNGYFSHIETYKFLRKVDVVHPDIIHLHNLHNCYINFRMLFQYIKKNNIPVVWTFHDCWPITGQCVWFDAVNCDKWKSGQCGNCKQINRYPKSYIDQTKRSYLLKRNCFTNVNNMVLVTPSKWLADKIEDSFLNVYPKRVIPNGIDTLVFHKTNNTFRNRYQLQKKFIILGVANRWEWRKGLDIFKKLAECLDTKRYAIVLVGANKHKIEERLLNNTNVITIKRTNNQTELAEIYSAANVFINPTREDNFPTTNMEALSCGTPVITFPTGGSPETVADGPGVITGEKDFESIIKAIVQIRKENFSEEQYDKYRKKVDKEVMAQAYFELYQELFQKKQER